MKILKKHWPLVLSALVLACSNLDFFSLGLDDASILGIVILISVVLFPICALITCAWYGYRILNPAKWLLILVFPVLEVISLTGGDFTEVRPIMVLLPAVPSALGLIIGSLLARKRKR